MLISSRKNKDRNPGDKLGASLLFARATGFKVISDVLHAFGAFRGSGNEPLPVGGGPRREWAEGTA
jgi:hypothetical protein